MGAVKKPALFSQKVHRPLSKLLKEGGKLSYSQMETEMLSLDPNEKSPMERFSSLPEIQIKRLGLFCITNLYALNKQKTKVPEHLLDRYVEMLATTEQKWILGLLQTFKLVRLNYIYNDILTARLVVEPEMHYECDSKLISPKLVDAEAMETACDHLKETLHSKMYAPDTLVLHNNKLHFKFNLTSYKLYEISLYQMKNLQASVIVLVQEAEAIVADLVKFLRAMLDNFTSPFLMLQVEGVEEMSLHQKLDMILTALKVLVDLHQKHHSKEIRQRIADAQVFEPLMVLIKQYLRDPTCVADDKDLVWVMFKKTIMLCNLLKVVNVPPSPETEQSYSLLFNERYVQHFNEIVRELEFPANIELAVESVNLCTFYPNPERVSLDKGGLDMDNLTRNVLASIIKQKTLLMDEVAEFEQYLELFKKQQEVWLRTLSKYVESLLLQNSDLSAVLSDVYRTHKIREDVNCVFKLVSTFKRIKLDPPLTKLLRELIIHFEIFRKSEYDVNFKAIAGDIIDPKPVLDRVQKLMQDPAHLKLDPKALLWRFKSSPDADWVGLIELEKAICDVTAFMNLRRLTDKQSLPKAFKLFSNLIAVANILKKKAIEEFSKASQDFLDMHSHVFYELNYNRFMTIVWNLGSALAGLIHKCKNNREPVSIYQQIDLMPGYAILLDNISQATDRSLALDYVLALSHVIHLDVFSEKTSDPIHLNLALNLYHTFKDRIFTIAGSLADKINLEGPVPTRYYNLFNKVSMVIEYLQEFTPEARVTNFEKQFASATEIFLDIFLLRPILVNVPSHWRTIDYPVSNSNGLALGLLYTQFQGITKVVKVSNLHLYAKYLKLVLRPGAMDELLVSSNDRARNFASFGRAGRIALEGLAQMGVSPDIGRLALSNVDQPTIESALQWLNDNREEVAMFNPRNVQELRRTSSNSQGDLLQLTNQTYSQKIREPIKSLIKGLFMVELYSKHSVLLQSLIVDSIECFDKEDFKLRSYKEFTKLMSRDLKANLSSQPTYDFSNLCIQVALLQKIVAKCSGKKDIRAVFMSEIFSKLLDILENIKNNPVGHPMTEAEEKMLSDILNIVVSLTPVLTPHKTSLKDQYGRVFSVLLGCVHHLTALKHELYSRSVEDSVVQLILKGFAQKNDPVILDWSSRLLLKVLDKKISTRLYDAVSLVFESDAQFVAANIECQIKSYFLARSRASKANSATSTNLGVVRAPKRDFLQAMERHNSSQVFYQQSKDLLKKKVEKTGSSRKTVYLIYQSDQNSFTDSKVLARPFSEFEPAPIQKLIISAILSKLANHPLQNQVIKCLHRLLSAYPLLRSYILQHPLGLDNQSVLNYLLSNISTSEDKLWNLLTAVCLQGSIPIRINSTNPNCKPILYSDYVAWRIVSHYHAYLSSLQHISLQKQTQFAWSVITLAYLLQLKNVHSLANCNFSQDQPVSVRGLLEKMLGSVELKHILFLIQPLTLLYKCQTFEALKDLYSVQEEIKEGSFQDQLIPVNVIFFGSTAAQRNQLVEQLQRTEEELQAEEDDPNVLINRMQRQMNRFSAVLQMTAQERNNNAEYLPIEVPQSTQPNKPNTAGKTAELAPQQQQQDTRIVEEQLPRYLEKLFALLPLHSYSTSPSLEQIAGPGPQVDFNLWLEGECRHERVPEKEPSYNCSKNNNYLSRLDAVLRLAQLSKPDLANTNSNNNRPGEGNAPGQRNPVDINLISYERLDRLSNMRDYLREQDLVAEREVRNMRRRVIEHMLGRGAEHRPEAETMRRDRQIDENHIERVLEEYVEPPKLAPLEVQKVVEVKPEKVEQPVEPKPVQAISEEQPIEPIASQPVSEPSGHMEVEQSAPMPVPVPAPAMEVENIVEPQVVQIPVQNVPAPALEMDVIIDNPPAQVAPAVPAAPAVAPISEATASVLNMLGLPNNYLDQIGVDRQLFDSLPNQYQVQYLMEAMEQNPPQAQPAANNPPPSQSGNLVQPEPNRPRLVSGDGLEIDPSVLDELPEELRRQIQQSLQPRDVTNQNVALLMSIENPAEREEILLQATPEFLETLTPALQAEAEVIRRRHLRRLVEQEEEEEMAQRGGLRRPRKNIVYPDIPADLFFELKEENVMAAIRSLYVVTPNTYKQMLLIGLLQNKKVQPKLVNTLLAALRQPFELPELPTSLVSFSSEGIRNYSGPVFKPQVRDRVLCLFADYFSSASYKDPKFLKQKISYQLYGKSQKLKALDKLMGEGFNDAEGHYPFLELLYYSLYNNLELAAQLIEGQTNLPSGILKRVIKSIKKICNDSSPSGLRLINSLSGLSENPLLKKLFEEYFPETNHPKIRIYTDLLKYKFSITSYLPVLHKKVLESYRPEYNEFLNQVFRIYTPQQMKELKFLEQHKGIHKRVIQYLVAGRKSIESQPISIILNFPYLLDFESKKEIFLNRLAKLGSMDRHFGRLQILANREDLFRSSFNQIMPRTAAELRTPISIMFDGELGHDAGGLTREWFELISREMFNPNYALFEFSSSGNTYQPSPKSSLDGGHLEYFKFIGRIVGKALMEECHVDAFFTRSFYKQILGQQLDLSDMEQQDYNFYKNMLWLKENSIDVDEGLNFTYMTETFGKVESKELIPNGAEISVTDANKNDYIEKYIFAKMRDSIGRQINAFKQGFYELIPQDLIKFFDAKELELLISGLPTIDFEDMRKNTEYSDYQPNDRVIVWFWEILATFDQQQLAQFVQFVTGTSKIPPEGFKALRGMRGPQKLSIQRAADISLLPIAHTCFNQLELPNYPSKQILLKKLTIALNSGAGFGFV